MPGPKPGSPSGNPAGRPKGIPNKATLEIKDLARQYAPAALEEIARLAREGKTEQTRVAASKEILDRAYGRPAQSVEMTGKDGGPVLTAVKIQFVNGSGGDG